MGSSRFGGLRWPLLKEGLGMRVWGLGFRVKGLGLRVKGLGFRVSFWMSDVGLRLRMGVGLQGFGVQKFLGKALGV